MNEKEKDLKKIENVQKKPDYFTIMPAVIRYDNRLRANEKILYSEILTLSRKNGYCYASNKYLSELYGVSTTIISKWISNLIKYGYLISENEYKAGTNYILRRKLYPANVNDILNKSSIYMEQMFNDHIEQKFNDHIEQKFKDNNTSINKMNNNKSNNSRAEPDNASKIPYKEIIEYLNKKADRDYRATSDKTRSLIKARVNEGFTLDDFKTVIDNKVLSWKGKADWDKYLRPQTLFGNKFESYLNEKPVVSDYDRSREEFLKGSTW